MSPRQAERALAQLLSEVEPRRPPRACRCVWPRSGCIRTWSRPAASGRPQSTWATARPAAGLRRPQPHDAARHPHRQADGRRLGRRVDRRHRRADGGAIDNPTGCASHCRPSAPGRALGRPNGHARGRRCRRHDSRIRPLAQCHKDRHRQDARSALEATASSARSSISCWKTAAKSTCMSFTASPSTWPPCAARRSRTSRSPGGLTCWPSAVVVSLQRSLRPCFHHWRLSEANLVMVFLAGVAWVAFRYGRGPAILASVASVLTFDFFFVPPYLTFAVERHAICARRLS